VGRGLKLLNRILIIYITQTMKEKFGDSYVRLAALEASSMPPCFNNS